MFQPFEDIYVGNQMDMKQDNSQNKNTVQQTIDDINTEVDSIYSKIQHKHNKYSIHYHPEHHHNDSKYLNIIPYEKTQNIEYQNIKEPSQTPQQIHVGYKNVGNLFF